MTSFHSPVPSFSSQSFDSTQNFDNTTYIDGFLSSVSDSENSETYQFSNHFSRCISRRCNLCEEIECERCSICHTQGCTGWLSHWNNSLLDPPVLKRTQNISFKKMGLISLFPSNNTSLCYFRSVDLGQYTTLKNVRQYVRMEIDVKVVLNS